MSDYSKPIPSQSMFVAKSAVNLVDRPDTSRVKSNYRSSIRPQKGDIVVL